MSLWNTHSFSPLPEDRTVFLHLFRQWLVVPDYHHVIAVVREGLSDLGVFDFLIGCVVNRTIAEHADIVMFIEEVCVAWRFRDEVLGFVRERSTCFIQVIKELGFKD